MSVRKKAKRPLILSVKRGKFRFDDPKSDLADQSFKKVRASVLGRDQYMCQYCDFRARKYQDVHHLDDNHENNNPDNLITACVLCHMVHHVGFAGQSKRGVLIYLDPKMGMDQASLNQLVRTLWIAEGSDYKPMRLQALTLLSRLFKASIHARRLVGSSDPTVLGDYLLGLDAASYEARAKALEGIYLLPIKDGYAPQIQYWKEDVYKSIPPRTWVEMAKQKHEQWSQLGDE